MIFLTNLSRLSFLALLLLRPLLLHLRLHGLVCVPLVRQLEVALVGHRDADLLGHIEHAVVVANIQIIPNNILQLRIILLINQSRLRQLRIV